MTPTQKQRMIFVIIILTGISIATVLALTAIGENILYFFSPSQITSGDYPKNRTLRVGGLVVENSVKRSDNSDLDVQFDLTDTQKSITVIYSGILPDLFREGQGIVAIGTIESNGLFKAEQVLAKHDENYMPPEVAEALKTAQQGGQMHLPNPHTPR